MQSISSHFVGIPGGIFMSLIAFSIVFIVCIGLMGMMMALKHFAQALEKSTANKETATTKPAAVQAPVAATPQQAVAAEDEEEVVAVITAAVMAMYGSAARIVSIKPTQAQPSGGSAWRMTGRLQNCEGFGD